jgi:hypothetical protein
MCPNITYRVTGVEEDGHRIIVGEGLTYAQADMICDRLQEWKMFSIVSLEPDPSPYDAEASETTRPERPDFRRRLDRILAALGLM